MLAVQNVRSLIGATLLCISLAVVLIGNLVLKAEKDTNFVKEYHKPDTLYGKL